MGVGFVLVRLSILVSFVADHRNTSSYKALWMIYAMGVESSGGGR